MHPSPSRRQAGQRTRTREEEAEQEEAVGVNREIGREAHGVRSSQVGYGKAIGHGTGPAGSADADAGAGGVRVDRCVM
jgi:hypothetical protein